MAEAGKFVIRVKNRYQGEDFLSLAQKMRVFSRILLGIVY